MHKLLSDLVSKMGIKPVEMTAEEKETFDRWNLVLTEEDVSVPQIAEFCQRMQSAIEIKWQDKYRDRTNDPYLADIHSVYGSIARLISAKRSEREALEIELQRKLDSTSPPSL